jgi:hypothetical protein
MAVGTIRNGAMPDHVTAGSSLWYYGLVTMATH